MKTDIYYFSGSGNALYVAKKLKEHITNSEMKSIPKVIDSESFKGVSIGIVCPIYYHNLPHIVADFIKKVVQAKYVFIVFAGAGELGIGGKVARKLLSKNNVVLSSVYNVVMPDNSTKYGEMPMERQLALFENADRKIKDVARDVSLGSKYNDNTNTNLFQTYIYPGMVLNILHKTMKTSDKSFTVTSKCNGCGTCSKVCPVDNIDIKKERPTWKCAGQCQVCLACHDWCPRSAIKHPGTKDDVKRYHHPSIDIREIIDASP